MSYKCLKYFSVALILFSCSQAKPTTDEIVGLWKSSDGSTIEFYSNDSVHIMDYPLNINNSSYKGLLRGTGEWKITKDPRDRWWSVQISAEGDRYIPELQSKGIAIELLISRTGDFGNGSEIKRLFVQKGDPDLDDRYEFKKIR